MAEPQKASQPNNPSKGTTPVSSDSEREMLLSSPRWDQSTFYGRALHFAHTTNPLHCTASSDDFDEATVLLTLKLTMI